MTDVPGEDTPSPACLCSPDTLTAAALLQETGKDPITQEALDIDDLVPVKTNKAVKPRPSPATSIPGLLGLFHNVSLFSAYACLDHLRGCQPALAVKPCHAALASSIEKTLYAAYFHCVMTRVLR